MDAQLSEVMSGLLLEDYSTGKTGSLVSREMVGANPEVNLAAVSLQIVRRNQEMDGILEANGWSQLQAFGDNIVKLYKERNGAEKVTPRPGMSEQEMAEASMQFEPITVDPNEVAGYRQQLAKIDAALRPLGSSVWTDPRTARIATILQNSAEPGRPGYLSDGEQNLNDQLDPFTKHVGLPVVEAIDTFVEGAAQVGVGARSILHDLGLVSLDGLTQGHPEAVYNGPTSWVQDADGTWYHNGGKVGATEVYAGVWYQLTGELIDQQMASYADAKATAAMQASGVQGLSVGLGQFMGAMGAFLGTGGPAMKAGAMLTKGLGVAVTGGKAAQSLSRTEKVVKILAERSGAAAALGALEATKSGRVEGYGKAMLHGTVMAVPMMVMGALGDRLERVFTRYKHLPAPAARALAGTVEGLGLDLGTWEAGWQFLRDPNDKTFGELAQQVMVNAIGNGILRGTGVTGAPPVHEFALPPDVQRQRKQERRAAAAAGDPVDVATQRGAAPETVQQLGEGVATMRASVGTDPETAFAASRQVQQAEQRMDVEEAGLAMPESKKLEARYATREELERLKKAPNTPEKRQEIIKLLNSSRMAFGKDFSSFVKQQAQAEESLMRGKKKEADEILAAEDTIKALLGTKHAGDYRKERNKRLLEQGIEPTDLAVEEGKGVKLQESGEDAEIAAMAKKLGISVEEMRAEMGLEPGKPEAPAKPPEQEAAEREAAIAKYRQEYARLRDPEPDVVEMAAKPADPREGQSASLRMRPSLEQEGVAGTKPIRASDVLRDMAGYEGDPIRVPIRKGVGMRGRVSTKGVLGWYSLNESVVRLAGARDVVVAAHEFSHAMDMKTKATEGIWSQLSPAETAGFIKAAFPYYPGYEKLGKRSQAMESWAEFWARFTLDDPTLQQETGAFHDWAMKWIADPKRATVLAQLQRIQSSLRQYRDQGAVSRVRQTMVLEQDQESLQELKARGVMVDTPVAIGMGVVRKMETAFMRTMVDDVYELKQAQKKWMEIAYGKERAAQEIADTDITANPTRLFDALRMTASKQAEAFLAIGTHDLAGNKTGESLREIFETIGEGRYENFLTYLNAKKSMEIIGKGKETQLDRADYMTAIEKLENPDFIEGAARIRAWSDRLIDYATQGGLFSAEQAKKIKESYKTYIPFQRVLEGPEQHAPGRGVAERGTGVKNLKGGQEEIRDPVNALGDMARNIIAKTHQAMVMKAMVKFGIVHKGVGGFITEVPRKSIPKDHPMMEIAEALRRASAGAAPDVAAGVEAATDFLEKAAAAGEIGASITLFGQMTIPKGSRPIIAYTPHFTEAELDAMPDRQRKMAESKNGKLLWLEVDVQAYESLMGIDVPQTILDKLPEVVQQIIEAPSKLVRLGATVLSPGFAVRNTLRDIAGDYVYTSDTNKSWLFSGVTRFAKGMIEQRKSSEAAQLFDALGGGVSTFFAGEVAAGRTAREMLRLNRTWFQQLRFNMGRFSDWMARNTEQPLRTEAFARTREQALAEGKSDLSANLEALEAAKEITINFARGGTISRALNRLIPYLNAGIQGNRKFFSTLAGGNGDVAKRQAWLRAITGITVPTIVLWALNQDEDWYQELPEWRRFNYWNAKLPGTDEIISIPKPFELGKLFGNVPEIMLDNLAVENPIAISDAVGDAVVSMIPDIRNIALLKPIVEATTNHDFFTGRDIVPEHLQRSRLPKDQYTAYTRMMGKIGADIARDFGLDPSPMMVEHIIDAYTGGMAGRLSDSVASAGGLMSLFQGKGARDLPVVGTLFRQGEFEQSRSVQEIFDLDAQFTRRAGSEQLDAAGKSDRRIVSRAKDDIAALKAAARSGTMARAEADRRSAEIARNTLERIKR